jgi:hypothetical protein
MDPLSRIILITWLKVMNSTTSMFILIVAIAVLIVIMRSDILEKLRLQTDSYSVLDTNYFAIVCTRVSTPIQNERWACLAMVGRLMGPFHIP